MRTFSHHYWLIWFIVGFGLFELLGLVHKDFDTLSQTWKWLRDSVPPWAAVLMSAALGATLLWLFTVHWLFTIIDKPGFDSLEKSIVLVGAVLGATSAVLAERKKNGMKAFNAVEMLLGIELDPDQDVQEAYQQYRSDLNLDKLREAVTAPAEEEEEEDE